MKPSALYYGGRDEQQFQPHFLDYCSLCQRQLAHNSDIFMYRGNTPFCSQECRQEQIEIDEANERRWKLCNSSKRSSNTNRNTTSDSRKESHDTNKAVRRGAVAVA